MEIFAIISLLGGIASMIVYFTLISRVLRMSDDIRSIKQKYVAQPQLSYRNKEEWVNSVVFEKYIRKVERSFIAGNKEAVNKYLDEYAQFALRELGPGHSYMEKVKSTYRYYNAPIPEYTH